MKKIKFLLFFILFTSCEKLLIEKDPENTPVNNFDIFWKTFDRHYYSFEMKGVNWDSVYTVYRPMVTENTSPKELYTIFYSMISLLNDAHVDIFQPYGQSWYYLIGDNPENSPKNAHRYIDSLKTLSSFGYGKISNYDIGYIRILTFEGETNLFNSKDENKEFKKIDDILSELKDLKGIIIDVRSNDGGNDDNSKTVASRFADKKRIYEYMKYRKSENKNDFISHTEYIEPRGNTYNKSVIVLTNRGTCSAAEGFVDMMKIFPNITIMGGNTSGGFGGATPFELPNGWTYRMTTSMSYDADWNCYENIGLPPDIEVNISDIDTTNRIDAILEKAIEYIK